jgi:arginase
LDDRVDVDLGDAATVIGSSRRDETTGVRALPHTIAAAHALAGALRAGMGTYPGRRPLVLGGDCSLLLGVFARLRPVLGEVGLWSVDGHPDYLDAPGSETGETADLQLAVLTGREHGNSTGTWCGADLLRDLRSVSDADPDAKPGSRTGNILTPTTQPI